MSLPRYITATAERPLAEVLHRAPSDFDPVRPGRPPWHQPSLDLYRVDWAVTENRREINLAVADRVELRGLDRETGERDWLEPQDWMPIGWGLPAQ